MTKAEVLKLSPKYLKTFLPILKDSVVENLKDIVQKMLDKLEDDYKDNYTDDYFKKAEELKEKFEVIDNELYERALRDWYE